MVAEAGRLEHRVPLPGGTRLHRLTRPEEADLVAEVHQAAFGDDRARTRAWVRDLLTDRADSSAVLVVLDGDRPLSAGRLEWEEGGEFAGTVGRRDRPGRPWPRPVPRPGRRTGPDRRRAGCALGPGRRDRPQQARPGPPRLPHAHHHDPVRVDAARRPTTGRPRGGGRAGPRLA